MFAVVKTGGKQYRVEPGAFLEVELLEGEVGEAVKFEEVLLFGDGTDTKIGQPLLKGAVVTAKIIEQKRAPKVTIFKKLKRHGRRLKKGHRQYLTRVKVEEITLG